MSTIQAASTVDVLDHDEVLSGCDLRPSGVEPAWLDLGQWLVDLTEAVELLARRAARAQQASGADSDGDTSCLFNDAAGGACRVFEAVRLLSRRVDSQ